MKRLFVLLLSIGLFSSYLVGQSLHYTYWEHAPLAVNPGMAGSFKGTIRASGIHRSQFTHQTWADIGGEYNLPFRPRGKDWITASLSLAQDVSGALSYTYQEFRLGGTYHLALDKKVTSDLALGIQMVGANASVNPMGNDLTRVQLLSVENDMDPDINNLLMSVNGAEDPSAGWNDWRAGLVYTKRGKKGSFTQFGIQAASVLPTPAGFAGERQTELDPRIGGFFLMDRMINKKVSILPAAFAQFRGPASEIMLRAMMGYELAAKDDIRIKGGLGYRLGNVGDTAQLILGADYKEWIFGLAFDVIASNRHIAEGQTLGAVELSAMKTFIIRKKPKVKPVIFCPRI